MSVEEKAETDPKSVEQVPEPLSPRNRTRVPKVSSTYRTRVPKLSTTYRSHGVNYVPELHNQIVISPNLPQWQRQMAVNHGHWRPDSHDTALYQVMCLVEGLPALRPRLDSNQRPAV